MKKLTRSRTGTGRPSWRRTRPSPEVAAELAILADAVRARRS